MEVKEELRGDSEDGKQRHRQLHCICDCGAEWQLRTVEDIWFSYDWFDSCKQPQSIVSRHKCDCQRWFDVLGKIVGYKHLGKRRAI